MAKSIAAEALIAVGGIETRLMSRREAIAIVMMDGGDRYFGSAPLVEGGPLSLAYASQMLGELTEDPAIKVTEFLRGLTGKKANADLVERVKDRIVISRPNTRESIVMMESKFSFDEVPQEPRARWFVKRGAKTQYDRGFATKDSANAWINAFGRRLDWRAGYSFQLRGDAVEMSIVGRLGNRPDAARPAPAAK